MATEPAPQISVIVPHYNDLANLALCLDALASQVGVAEPFEVIVADNNSPCGIAAVESVAAGRARVVLQTEKGAGPARNAAVAAARGAVFAFIDSDCIAHPRWLAAGVAALARWPVVGGRVDVGTAPRGQRSGAEVFEAIFAFQMRDYIERKGFAGSGNLFVSRENFMKVGLFGNGLSEDVDWSRRARAAGLSIGYCDEAAVTHPARVTWDELTRKWSRINRETVLVERKRGGSAMGWRLRQGAVLLSALAHAPRVLARPGLTMKERARGLGTLFAIRAWRAGDALRIDYNA